MSVSFGTFDKRTRPARPASASDRTAAAARPPADSAGPRPPAEPAGPTARTDPPATGRRPHLHRVDLIRDIAFLCVIVVHVIGVTYPFPGEGPAFTQLVLHATRAVFFFVSTFVLFHSAYHRPLRVGSFLGRRFKLLGAPYLLWSTAYWTLGDHARIRDDLPGALGDLRGGIVWGGSWYHLYFLLVSLQIAVLFPLLLKLVRVTTGRHLPLLAVTAAVQLAALVVLFHPTPLSGPLEWYRTHGGMLLPTYGFFVLSGALAAVHLDAFHAWIVGHTRTVCAGTLGMLALTWLWYRHTVAGGRDTATASMATQPVSLLWGPVAVIALYALACRWERARRPVPGRRAAALGAQLAFGVYLVHPMILRLLELSGFAAALPWSPAVDTIVLVAVVATGSAGFAWLVARTPVAPWVIGRERMRGGRPASVTVRRSTPAGPPRRAHGQHRGSRSFTDPVVSNHASGA
ncbi:acyltransferase [Embleya sp. NPDC020630]|uniref:acyltransferase n=1 Tax=Embleya sp. NPDC020630 TaxID=3363979 RepID=UPI0037A40543